jgi:hypothetical protein
LTGGALHRVAVLGPNAVSGRTFGGGSAVVHPPCTVSPRDGLRAALPPSVQLETASGGRIHTRLRPADPVLLRTPGNLGLEGCEVRRGRDVVQVYLSRPDSAVERPLRRPAGHAGPTADPGETATAEIVVPRRAFAHRDVTAQTGSSNRAASNCTSAAPWST